MNYKMPKTILVRRVPTKVISLKEGGKVNKTGLHMLHKGEVVLPAKDVKMLQKLMPSKTMKGGFKKGSKSKTRPGEKDFTTKKTSKDFNRGGKREKTAQGSKVKRRPFSK
jgi:hypothetical protein